ncbi:M15 family metallopeptidase [Nocardiopsis ganjiahuensis]|uniref:M15 family metallopeptidase n=1 Tax=Nocardiopsis ganjiahuensis TaxID=239984 RepID=UPI00034A09B7|nr:M15 family metallopeptidase [Nocardiopsis ganjiahuensis]
MRCARFRPTVLSTAVLAVLALAGCAAAGPGGGDVSEEKAGRDWTSELPVNRLAPLGEGDGFVPEGGSLDPSDDVPALTGLDPELLAAVREAADAALEEDGIEAVVTSGWRSERYQRFLLDSAVEVYGSEEEAARWVSSPEDSSHVTGSAVDIGRTDAAYWFARHGARFGLCQTYANEVWHYELTVDPGGTCPEPLADASAG